MSEDSFMPSTGQKTDSTINSSLSFFRRIDTAIIVLQRWSMVVSASLLAIMAFLGAVDVLSFSLFGFPIPIMTDLISALLPGVVFLAMAHAQYKKEHIQVDLLTKFLPSRLVTLTILLALVFSCLLFAGLTFGAWQLAIKSYLIDERAVAVYDFQIWPSKICFAIGASLALLESCRQLVHVLFVDFQGSSKVSILISHDDKRPSL